MVISSVKRLQHIYVYTYLYACYAYTAEEHRAHSAQTHTRTHLSLYPLLFHTSFYSHFDKFAWDLVKNVTVRSGQSWIHFFWENKLQENALTSTPFLSFPLSFFILVFFSLSAVPIIPLKWVPRCACIRRQYADTRPYSCIMYSRCIENVSSEIGCVPRCQGIPSTLNFNKF